MSKIDLTDAEQVRLLNNDPASWEAIETYLTKNGDRCRECKFGKTFSQHHGEGMTEQFFECAVLDGNAALQPCDCPAFAEGEAPMPNDGEEEEE